MDRILRTALLSALALLATWAFSAPAFAQGSARLYGFEKASFVNGTVTIFPERGEVAVTGFSSRYREAMTLFAARGFDPRGAVRVGELPPGFTGDLSFAMPPGAEGMDTVILLVPSDDTPVGLGLLR